jgi:hypothetical protein
VPAWTTVSRPADADETPRRTSGASVRATGRRASRRRLRADGDLAVRSGEGRARAAGRASDTHAGRDRLRRPRWQAMRCPRVAQAQGRRVITIRGVVSSGHLADDVGMPRVDRPRPAGASLSAFLASERGGSRRARIAAGRSRRRRPS